MPGLGVRVRPSGGRSYVLLLEAGGRSKTCLAWSCLDHDHCPGSSGDAMRARVEPGCQRNLPPPFARGPCSYGLSSRVEWKEAHFDRYKDLDDKEASRYACLPSRILPAFGSKPLDRITPKQVRRWFDTFSRTAPGNANLCSRPSCGRS